LLSRVFGPLITNLTGSDGGKAKAAPSDGLSVLALNVTDDAAEQGSDAAQCLVGALELLSMA
jgi:hypothetical protein